MVISLDIENTLYQPFGRFVIDYIPNHKIKNDNIKRKIVKGNASDDDEDADVDDYDYDVEKNAEEFNVEEDSMFYSFNNDFLTAELDITRDLFHPINQINTRREKFIPMEFWKLTKSSNGEEEIYVKSNSLICSYRSFDSNEHSFMERSFTFDENIIDVIYSDFIIDDNITIKAYLNALKTEPRNNFQQYLSPTSKIINALCVLHKFSLHIISKNGYYDKKKLPFLINKIIPSNYGLLLERKEFENESSKLPTLFSLSNPLNNLHPIMFVDNKLKGSYNNLKLVDIIQENNLAVFYCTKSKNHLIFQMRLVTESDLELSRCNDVSHRNLDLSSNLVSTPLSNDISKKQQISNLSKNNLFSILQPGNPFSSPYVSNTGTLNSPLPSRHSLTADVNFKQILTPSPRLSNLINSRIDSPVSPNLCNQPFSNATRLIDQELDMLSHVYDDSMNVNLSRSSKTQASSLRSLLAQNNELLHQNFYVNNSEFSFEYLWSDTPNSDPSISDSMATKVFISTDFFGQQYLCLLIKIRTVLSSTINKFLKLIKLDKIKTKNNDPEKNSKLIDRFTFTTVMTMSIQDAEPLPSLKMMLVLDENHSLILYSGIYKIANIQNSNLNKMKIFENKSKILNNNKSFDGDSLEFSEFLEFKSENIHASSPINTFHHKTLLCQPSSSIKMDVSILSPDECLHSTNNFISTNKIISLRDGIHNRVTLETSDSNCYRITLPPMVTTFLVDKCLGALCQSLRNDVMVELISSWYTFRNSTNNSEEIMSEIILFKIYLLSSIGFDKESIKKYYKDTKQILFNNSSIPDNDDLNDSANNNDFYQLFSEEELFDVFKTLSNDNRKDEFISSMSDKRIKHSMVKPNQFNSPGFLFPYSPHILYSLHLIYEDLKLVQIAWSLCETMVDILYFLSVYLKLPNYQDHYFKDFHLICSELSTEYDTKFSESLNKLIIPKYFIEKPVSVFRILFYYQRNKLYKKKRKSKFPYLSWYGKSKQIDDCLILTPNIFNVIFIYANIYMNNLVHPKQILKHVGNTIRSGLNNSFFNFKKFQQITHYLTSKSNSKRARSRLLRTKKEKILFLLSTLGIDQHYLKYLTIGISLPIWTKIINFRNNPKYDWCPSIYSLIDRTDLLSFKRPILKKFHRDDIIFTTDLDPLEELDYLDQSVLSLLFPNEQNLLEAYRMLISCKVMNIDVKREQGMSDQELQDEQEKQLLTLSIRAMAQPVGRGMITLRSFDPIVVDKFPIPSLVLQGQVPNKIAKLTLNRLENLAQNLNMWPLFHNGVSAGLRMSSNKMVDSSWILFNKPPSTSSTDEHYEHAGFLFALGINGFLDNLSIMDLHDYLSKGNDLTKVGILLGLAASRRGTMDSCAFVLLGIHLEGLLPSNEYSTDMNVSPIVRVAAVLGTGLLYQATGHRYISEVMLNEIGRPPGPEMDHYIDRESYALSAGLAFGLVTLGRGNELMNIVTSDGISIPDQLNHYMLGVHKKLSTLQKERSKTPSYHIREGDCINADVTSPGATLALGMMFFNTENEAIVQWLKVPDTQNLLEMVRPDFLLLRVLAKNLILWSKIEPTAEWIESHIPSIIYKNAFEQNSSVEKGLENELMFLDDIDYETMTQSYCNIIAGACFSLALRYAGTANEEAYKVIYKYTFKLVNITSSGQNSKIEQAGRSTIESCINVLIVSCSIIMAGTGNLEVMRVCRYLRCRISQPHVLFGSHMASHMALGLLFLGGCRMTLNSSPESVAALIIAFFPKYPIHTNDNRYHLQAFRHLYVLACESRLLVPRCIENGSPVYANISYTFKDKSIPPVTKKAPCLLPDLKLLKKVELVDKQYWKISFQSDFNFNRLKDCLKLFDGNLYIKKKDRSYIREHFRDKKKSLCKLITKNHLVFDFSHFSILKTFFVACNQEYNYAQDLNFKGHLFEILYACSEDASMSLFESLIKIASAIYFRFKKAKENKYNFENSSFKSFFIWQIKFAYEFAETFEKNYSKYQIFNDAYLSLDNQTFEVNKDKNFREYSKKTISIQNCEDVIDAINFRNIPFEAYDWEEELETIMKVLARRASLAKF